MYNFQSILVFYSFSSLFLLISNLFSPAQTKVTELFRSSVTSVTLKSEILSQNRSVILNNEILKNSIYTIENRETSSQEFHLNNGRAEFRYGTGATQRNIVTIVEPWIRYGDLNYDQSLDAIAILAYSSGSSGTFIYLATMLNQEGKAINVATEFLGDRIKIHSLSIENKQIFITFSERNREERILYQFTLNSGKLTKEEISNHILNKITFDLTNISPEGLIGNHNNLRSLSYEFCIPKNSQYLFQIKDLDSTISFSNSKGRIGCTEKEYLCIGDTHKPNWREILIGIAKLSYVAKINQFFGE